MNKPNENGMTLPGTTADRVSDIAPNIAVEFLIEHAIHCGASDLYLDCEATGVSVSARRLGRQQSVLKLPIESGQRCISHLEAESGMQRGDRRQPRHGHWRVQMRGGEPVYIRLHAMPTLYGESLAVRLLNRNGKLQALDSLGLTGPQLRELTALLHRPGGLILFTGPTGCGKTTTAYACLHRLNDGNRLIHTIEDPVEYPVNGLRQTQFDELSNIGMADMLRGVLRHGPDVLMVGEIRDTETAETVVSAANSGRLVLATLNSPFAASAIQRLVTLGILPEFLLSGLRTLSPESKVSVNLGAAPRTFEEVREYLAPGEGTVVYAARREQGDESYSGLSGVFEVMRITPKLRNMVLEGHSPQRITSQAVEDGMLDLRRAALLKVAQGLTCFDELQRIVPNDETETAESTEPARSLHSQSTERRA